MKFLPIPLILLSLAWPNSSDAQRSIAILKSSSYSKKTRLTTYSVFPFGTVTFPGKWRKTAHYDVSGQQNFSLGDTLKTAIAINRAVVYPFFNKEYSEARMAREMYEWDSQYLVERLGGERTIVKDDTVNHFIIWKLSSGSDQADKSPTYLFGSERGIVYNLNIATNRWTEDQKVRFLEDMYRSRKTGTCCDPSSVGRK